MCAKTPCSNRTSLQDEKHLSLAKGMWDVMLQINVKIKCDVYNINKQEKEGIKCQIQTDLLPINVFKNLFQFIKASDEVYLTL